jgi:hypothetical protein
MHGATMRRTDAVSVYVYGVTRAEARLPRDARGVGDPPARVRKLVAGRFAAVVSAAPARLRASRRDLRAHQDLLLALAGGGPLLPSRFGVLAADDDGVRARLRAEAGGYAAALDRVDGRVELNLKGTVVEDGLADLLSEDPRLRRLREEVRQRPGYAASIRLGEAVVAGLRHRASAAGARTAAALTELAEDTRPGPDVAEYVLNVSFLVAADRVAGFRRAVDDLAARHTGRIALRLTGPLPCYSFSTLPTPTPAGV